MNRYSKRYLAAIKAAALAQVPGSVKVLHIRPRAYCVAKPAARCAVFATPPEDSVELIRGTQNATAQISHDWPDSLDVKVGGWYCLAYVCKPGCSTTHVIDV